MAKKTFRENNPAARFISAAEQDAREIPSAPDAPDIQEQDAPSAPEEQKAGRINMAFSAENYEYLKLMARVEGTSATRYVNQLIDEDRETRAEDYQRIKAFFKGVVKQ